MHTTQRTVIKVIFFTALGVYPFSYFHDKNGYQAFAKVKNKKIKGIIVVHKDSDIFNIEQLAKQRIAFPPAGTFGATILPRSEMEKLKTPYTPKFVYSHDSVYSNIVLGRYKAGGGVVRALDVISNKVKKKLRILFTTKGYTPHAFTANKELPQYVAMKFQTSLTTLESTAKNNELLKKLYFKGIVSSADADWDDVRMLNISYSK